MGSTPPPLDCTTHGGGIDLRVRSEVKLLTTPFTPLRYCLRKYKLRFAMVENSV